jgi:aminopeptidase
MTSELVDIATTNIQDILQHSVKITPANRALVIYDTEYELTNILTAGYITAFENLQTTVEYHDFNTLTDSGTDHTKVKQLFDNLSPGDLVVLIQTSNFRLNDFRIRIQLFAQHLRVIEHGRLYRNSPDTFDVYLNSLKYDTDERMWYTTMKNQLTDQLTSASHLKFNTLGSELLVGELEMPKPNIGDYTGMENIGGTFPIGEVFTEAKDFSTMNGSVYIYAFADRDFNVSYHEPFRLDISEGLVIGYGDNTPQEFIDILNLIKSFERPLIREIGFGLNRAMTKERPLGDITAFERILGIHFSLGEKHSVYKKPGITTHKTKFHVDLFLTIEQVSATIDNTNTLIMDKDGYC